jgi:hypothetical protein
MTSNNGPGRSGRADARLPASGRLPADGLNPHTPHRCAGPRIEPPTSLPRSNAESPAATAAALPPELPPGVRARSHGLFVRPKSGLLVWLPDASGGRLVLPSRMAPAARSLATTGASATGTWSANLG